MKILFVGDVVGRIGRLTAKKIIPKLKKENKINFVVANVENAAHGSGVTENIIKELQDDSKIDFFTLGDHAFSNKKDFSFFNRYPIIRPANFPEGVPGHGYRIATVKGRKILFVSLIGRVFMKADFDCPFRKMDEILANKDLLQEKYFAIIVDIHAETSSEKVCLKHYLDGRVSALLGTHTHIPTADAEITEKGLAYITDVGMTGFSDGSLGLEKDGIIETFLTQIKNKHVIPEKGRTVLNAVIVELSDETGKAKKIKQITEFLNIK